MSGKKRTPTSSASSEVTAAVTKKAKQHCLQAPANINDQSASCKPGSSGTTFELDTNTSSSIVPATETTYQSCAQDRNCHNTSEKSNHLSTFLNLNIRPLPLVKLTQCSINVYNKMLEIICDLHYKCQFTAVGSLAEGLDMFTTSDVDFIVFKDKYKVLESINEKYDLSYPWIPVVRLPAEDYPGYSKLHVISPDCFQIGGDQNQYTVAKDDKIFLKNNLKEFILDSEFESSTDIIYHGPAFTFEHHEKDIKKMYEEHDIGMPEAVESKHFDIVFCLKGTQWPAEASEWKTRNRAFHWPNDTLINKIINAGYFLAAVGSKESKENDIQWRVSFNQGEQLIIQSFNETQIHCILLLKNLKDNLSDILIAGKNITSYSMKTVMFWCLEETSEGFWKPSNLMCCFRFCLSKLKKFVDECNLPNYFIKARNQFVASEFTSVIKINTSRYLERLLVEPYISDTNIQRHPMSHTRLIKNWLILQVKITQLYRCVFCQGFWDLYDGNNIKNILSRCKLALDKLERASFAQPIIKNLQSFLGVLHYILLRDEKEKGVQGLNQNARKLYSYYMTESASGDLTHAILRIATCYFDDGEKEDSLKKIKTVTDLDTDFFMETHGQRLIKTLHCDIDALNETQLRDIDMEIYKSIIYKTDLIHQGPYKITDDFEQKKKNDHVLIGYDTLTLAWTRSYFDVTFMQAELPILPKPVAVEFCIGIDQKRISFHPYIYGLLLEYLWHAKYGSGNREKQLVLAKLKICVSTDSMIPDEQKSVGLNFMAYCYSLQKDHQLASRCLVRSLKLNTVRKNVAYWYMFYMKYRIKRIRELSLDSQS